MAAGIAGSYQGIIVGPVSEGYFYIVKTENLGDSDERVEPTGDGLATRNRSISPMAAFASVFRRRLASAGGFAIAVCLLTIASTARAEPPLFITPPPAISSVANFSQAQESSSASADGNQALMGQIINQLNENELQSSVTAAQTAAQRAVFVPQQTFTFKHAK